MGLTALREEKKHRQNQIKPCVTFLYQVLYQFVQEMY